MPILRTPSPALLARRFLAGFRLVASLALISCVLSPPSALAAEPLTVLDMASVPDLPPGPPFSQWLAARSGWEVKFGSPAYFFTQAKSLHLVARPGPMAASVLFWRQLKREDKVLLRITRDGFRVKPSLFPRLEVTMAPVRLPGHGADLTDSARNDACFYLLVSFDGKKHFYRGSWVPQTLAYVWADGAWRTPGVVGKEAKYGDFMRYLALGRGDDPTAQLRPLIRDLAADFRLAYPERAHEPMPDVIEVGLMIDSNTVHSEAESLVRTIRFLP